MRQLTRLLAALILAGLLTPAPVAQLAPRQLTTVDAIRQYPGYFHLRDVAVRGEFVESALGYSLGADGRQLDLLLGENRALDGPVEVRGHLLDIGRLEPGDPRLASYAAPPPEAWPARGEQLLLRVDRVDVVQPTSASTLRSIALEPWRFDGETVTITGQFHGRNILGDLPTAPRQSEHDFVLTASGAALWVTDLEPKGRDFELNVTARVDTAQWVRVTGVVARQSGLVIVQGATIALADPSSDSASGAESALPLTARLVPPADAIFSVPTTGETLVDRETTVRIQFSRGLDQESVARGVSARYVSASESGPELDAPLELAVTYTTATDSIEVTFDDPLEPFRMVRVELTESLQTFDAQPVTPFAVVFTTGP